jgi:hypothetical protein
MSKRLLFKVFLLFLALTISIKIPPFFEAPLKLSVMSFNVENLFDLRDDPGKDDATYLPIAQKRGFEHRGKCWKIAVRKWREDCLSLDWSEAALTQKLSRIAQVIRSATLDGRGPDLVLLQEVEKLSLLERLISQFLPHSGYRAVLIEGPDERGIDVALLTRLPVFETHLHRIPFRDRRFVSRALLEVGLRDPRFGHVRVFVLHLPSAFHSSDKRAQALVHLNTLAQQARAKGALVIAGGDFNISAQEEERQGLVARYGRADWFVTQVEGCRFCPGTISHRGRWSFFDQIWVLKAGRPREWRFRPESVRLVNRLTFQRQSRIWVLGRWIDALAGPRRFALGKAGEIEGLSDHWPVATDLEIKFQ